LKLNAHPRWREILGKDKQDSRQKDVELILRFFSLLTLEGYSKPMKDHLSRFMRRNSSISADRATELEALFGATCEKVVAGLGKKPFHVRAGLNAAVYDSVMAAFAAASIVPKNIVDRYKALLANDSYVKVTSQSTTDEDSVKQRFSLAAKTLFG
jgi:hypothetical protein